MKDFLQRLKGKFKDNRAIGTVEIILILVVLIALVILFKDEIMTLADSIFAQISTSATSVWK